ncbi:DNA replication ATP-dependent helicase/nuclease DNA2 [Cephus cinctus]|uniref:DNA replication ATP-dependent helicase/nuclease n=1 Tax=Cephus cinctus TaxID=211228 RepID=A0AAJ7CE57_CEPCN|nr:DNA replication ATP-dependent helicase/nuclease DNA2 [Cephus cinctus]
MNETHDRKARPSTQDGEPQRTFSSFFAKSTLSQRYTNDMNKNPNRKRTPDEDDDKIFKKQRTGLLSLEERDSRDDTTKDFTNDHITKTIKLENKHNTKNDSCMLNDNANRETSSSPKNILCFKNSPLKQSPPRGITSKSLTPKRSAMKNLSEKENIEASTSVNYSSTKHITCPLKEKIKEENDQHDDFDDFFDNEWSDTDLELATEADLSSLRRYTIIDAKLDNKSTIVTVQDEETKVVSNVYCSGYWRDIKYETGEIITIQAIKESNKWIVDNNNGFIITEPDKLVSGTSVVGALFCTRRGVLNERFRGIDCLPFCEPDVSLMTVGILVHEILQKVLTDKIYDLPEISQLANATLRSWQVVNMLYSSGMSTNECKKRIAEYITRIDEFIQRYIKEKKPKNPDNNFDGKIEKVHEIEENIWLPKLGIKGKVDATVEVRINDRRRIVPLELKTGRASFSAEHKGQIILYTMLMRYTGRDVDSGLLLYLKENTMREMKSGHHEKRDLILLRNSLAHYLTKEPDVVLPEPINHHSACSTCPYNAICSAYLTKEKNYKLSDNHPLNSVSARVLKNVTEKHIDYVLEWIKFLEIEEDAQTEGISLRDIWTKTPQEREKNSKCLGNLSVVNKVTEECGKYEHKFSRATKTNKNSIDDFRRTNFTESEYVIISTNTRINISSGFITDIQEDFIAVLLDRNITSQNHNSTYHIDKYISSNLLSCSLVNLGGLLSNHDTCDKLRKIIIDKTPATFKAKLPAAVAMNSADILYRLNKLQKRAIIKTIAANEYILIKGMPGTGKTQTLVALIELLAKTGKSVLVTAHTNSAVDNILLKLLEKDIDFLRLGSSAKIHPALRNNSEASFATYCTTAEALEAAYKKKNVVGVTCFGANHPLLRRRKFDVCTVDESTQVLQPTLLRPLYAANKFVLLGDPEQLPPIVKSEVARKCGMGESLFVRLDNENNTIELVLQYRMNTTIMNLANSLTYKGKLKAGNDAVADATLKVKDESILESRSRWIAKILSTKLNDSVVIVNTDKTYDLHSKTKLESDNYGEERGSVNVGEAAIVVKLIHTLLKAGVNPDDIGVIAPYRAQVSLLKKQVHPHDIEVNTVDQYQGRDKSVILYSCTKSLPQEKWEKKYEFQILDDHQRLTVAITRSKHKLIIVCDKPTMENFLPFKKLFAHCREEDFVNLRDNHNDFSWKELLEL